MPMGNVGETVSGMFGDLKSKLGFNREENRYDDYDEYADFDEYSEYGDNYRDDEPVGGYRPLTNSVSRSNRYVSSDISSSLVSKDDVKMSTPLPDLPSYSASSNDGARSSRSRSVIDATAPAYSSPAYNAARSESDAGSGTGSSSRAGSVGGYDPYVAYSTSDPATHAPTRSLTVIKPAAYGDVERVAKAVKAGDVVVLAMRYTPDDLSKRILDFAFGVASALDANVECPGEKVFAIAQGSGLTADEKRRLGAQGVL